MSCVERQLAQALTDAIDRHVVEVRVDELRAVEASRLGHECVVVEVCHQQRDSYAPWFDRLAEPGHPLVRDPEVDQLCRDGARTGTDCRTGQPPHRAPDEQADQSGPHRAGQRRPLRLRIDRLAHGDLTVERLRDDHRVLEDQVSLRRQPRRCSEELLRAKCVVEGNTDQCLRSVVFFVVSCHATLLYRTSADLAAVWSGICETETTVDDDHLTGCERGKV